MSPVVLFKGTADMLLKKRHNRNEIMYDKTASLESAKVKESKLIGWSFEKDILDNSPKLGLCSPFRTTTIFVQPWSVTIFLRMFTFWTYRFCLVVCRFGPMRPCWLRRGADGVLGAVRACFVHVLWNFSGFPCGGACFVHVLWNFMVCETANTEICCAPKCSNSSMIWEMEIDGECTFNTSMSSRSSSCNFSDVSPL